MNKRKDNLTDIVEQLPKTETVEDPKPPKNQQVLNSDGELITLGHKPDKRGRPNTYGKSLELIDIERVVKETVKEVMDDFGKKVLKAVEEKLKKIK